MLTTASSLGIGKEDPGSLADRGREPCTAEEFLSLSHVCLSSATAELLQLPATCLPNQNTARVNEIAL